MRSASRTRVQAILLRNPLQLGPVCRNYHHAVPTKPPLCPSESDFMSPPSTLPTPRCTPSFPLVPCFFSFSLSLFCPTADQSVNSRYCARLCGRAAVCLGRNSSPARPPHARRDPADCPPTSRLMDVKRAQGGGATMTPGWESVCVFR